VARNGSGTYSVVNSFTTGNTISSSSMNANFTDVATALTGSLPRDGQAGMTGQFKAASGTVALPGISFESDTNTGFYAKSADVLGAVVGGVEVGTISSTGFSSFAAGTVMLFAQTAAPTGWTKSTTHNDKVLRVVSGTAAYGGSTAFSSVFIARTILEANLPAHTHAAGTLATASDGLHNHTFPYASSSDVATTGGGARITSVTVGGSTSQVSDSGAHTHTITGSTGSIGSGTAMDFAVQYVDVILATKD
jgi:hypothetical protein